MSQPSVAVLLAVYNPKVSWFCELLDSINAQTYQNLSLYVRNDASTKISREEVEKTVAEHITKIPFVIHHNEENLGSTKTFEALVLDCKEDFIAFCDQDDVWLPEKIEKTLRLFEESPLSPTLVCTELRIMDGEGKILSPNMQTYRRRHRFFRGAKLAPSLIYRNFVMGCTLLMKRDRALSYLPIPKCMIHDHYLAFRAAMDGAIDYLEEPQILYRVYGGNQTGILVGVKTKEDYHVKHIGDFADRLDALRPYAGSMPEYEKATEWLTAREKNWNRKKGAFRSLFALRSCNPSTTKFELFVLRMPKPLFRLTVYLIKKRIL